MKVIGAVRMVSKTPNHLINLLFDLMVRKRNGPDKRSSFLCSFKERHLCDLYLAAQSSALLQWSILNLSLIRYLSVTNKPYAT
jgi:hypothetical protein